MTYIEKIKAQIIAAKQELNAVILAHYYQIPDIQDIADHVGDSFALSKLASQLPEKVIVFCGVHFMGETAKVLSPEKTVLQPVKGAGCPMADMVSAQELKQLKQQYPDAATVAYVNSSTEVKALSDICCTSANAVEVVRSLPHKRIIFVPDQHLGSYVAEKLPEKIFILVSGYCPPHDAVKKKNVLKVKEKHPEAQLLVHPECRREVRQEAAFIGSTAQIIQYVRNSKHNAFIIGTEEGILHPLKKENPDKIFHMLMRDFLCPDMKKTTLKKLLSCLNEQKHVVEVADEVAALARKPLERMLAC